MVIANHKVILIHYVKMKAAVMKIVKQMSTRNQIRETALKFLFGKGDKPPLILLSPAIRAEDALISYRGCLISYRVY